MSFNRIFFSALSGAFNQLSGSREALRRRVEAIQRGIEPLHTPLSGESDDMVFNQLADLAASSVRVSSAAADVLTGVLSNASRASLARLEKQGYTKPERIFEAEITVGEYLETLPDNLREEEQARFLSEEFEKPDWRQSPYLSVFPGRGGYTLSEAGLSRTIRNPLVEQMTELLEEKLSFRPLGMAILTESGITDPERVADIASGGHFTREEANLINASNFNLGDVRAFFGVRNIRQARDVILGNTVRGLAAFGQAREARGGSNMFEDVQEGILSVAESIHTFEPYRLNEEGKVYGTSAEVFALQKGAAAALQRGRQDEQFRLALAKLSIQGDLHGLTETEALASVVDAIYDEQYRVPSSGLPTNFYDPEFDHLFTPDPKGTQLSNLVQAGVNPGFAQGVRGKVRTPEDISALRYRGQTSELPVPGHQLTIYQNDIPYLVSQARLGNTNAKELLRFVRQQQPRPYGLPVDPDLAAAAEYNALRYESGANDAPGSVHDFAYSRYQNQYGYQAPSLPGFDPTRDSREDFQRRMSAWGRSFYEHNARLNEIDPTALPGREPSGYDAPIDFTSPGDMQRRKYVFGIAMPFSNELTAYTPDQIAFARQQQRGALARLYKEFPDLPSVPNLVNKGIMRSYFQNYSVSEEIRRAAISRYEALSPEASLVHWLPKDPRFVTPQAGNLYIAEAREQAIQNFNLLTGDERFPTNDFLVSLGERIGVTSNPNARFGTLRTSGDRRMWKGARQTIEQYFPALKNPQWMKNSEIAPLLAQEGLPNAFYAVAEQRGFFSRRLIARAPGHEEYRFLLGRNGVPVAEVRGEGYSGPSHVEPTAADKIKAYVIAAREGLQVLKMDHTHPVGVHGASREDLEIDMEGRRIARAPLPGEGDVFKNQYGKPTSYKVGPAGLGAAIDRAINKATPWGEYWQSRGLDPQYLMQRFQNLGSTPSEAYDAIRGQYDLDNPIPGRVDNVERNKRISERLGVPGRPRQTRGGASLRLSKSEEEELWAEIDAQMAAESGPPSSDPIDQLRANWGSTGDLDEGKANPVDYLERVRNFNYQARIPGRPGAARGGAGMPPIGPPGGIPLGFAQGGMGNMGSGRGTGEILGDVNEELEKFVRNLRSGNNAMSLGGVGGGDPAFGMSKDQIRHDAAVRRYSRETGIDPADFEDADWDLIQKNLNMREGGTRFRQTRSTVGGLLYGAYMARRMFGYIAQPILEQGLESATRDYALPSFIGTSGQSYATMTPGAGFRSAVGREFMGRGAYEQFGGFQELGYALSGTDYGENMARFSAAGRLGLGFAAAGSEVGIGLSLVGGRDSTIGRAGRFVTGASVALGLTIPVVSAAMEYYNVSHGLSGSSAVTFDNMLRRGAGSYWNVKEGIEQGYASSGNKTLDTVAPWAAGVYSAFAPGAFNEQMRAQFGGEEFPIDPAGIPQSMRNFIGVLDETPEEKRARAVTTLAGGIVNRDPTELVPIYARLKGAIPSLGTDKQVTRLASTHFNIPGKTVELPNGGFYRVQGGTEDRFARFVETGQTSGYGGPEDMLELYEAIRSQRGIEPGSVAADQLLDELSGRSLPELERIAGAASRFAGRVGRFSMFTGSIEGSRIATQYGIDTETEATNYAQLLQGLETYGADLGRPAAYDPSLRQYTSTAESVAATQQRFGAVTTSSVYGNFVAPALQAGFDPNQGSYLLNTLSGVFSGYSQRRIGLAGQIAGGDLRAASYASYNDVGVLNTLGLDPNAMRFFDRSGNQILETSGQDFMRLGVANYMQGLSSAAPFGGFNFMQAPADAVSQMYGVSNPLAQAFLDGGLRGAQAYTRTELRANQAASIGVSFAGLAETREYLSNLYPLQDAQRVLGHENQLANFAAQERRLELNWQFGNRQADLSLRRMDLSNAFNLQQMDFGYQGQLLQREFTQEQQGYSDTLRGLNFGFQMEDLNEAIRFSSGRQRRQLLRQRGRLALTHNIEEQQIDSQRENQEQLWAREDEQYQQRREYTEELMALDREQFDLSQEQRRTFYQEDRENLERQREYYQESYDIQGQIIELNRDHQQRQLDFQAAQLGLQAENIRLQQELEDLTRETNQNWSDMAGELGQINQYGNNVLIMEAIANMLEGMSGIPLGVIESLKDLVDAMSDAQPLGNSGGGGTGDNFE